MHFIHAMIHVASCFSDPLLLLTAVFIGRLFLLKCHSDWEVVLIHLSKSSCPVSSRH